MTRAIGKVSGQAIAQHLLRVTEAHAAAHTVGPAEIAEMVKVERSLRDSRVAEEAKGHVDGQS